MFTVIAVIDYSATTAGARSRVEQRVDDGVGVDRHAVVMANRCQAADQVRWELGAQNAVELSVAILLDDVNAVVTLHERGDLGRERQRAHAHIVELDTGLAQEVARLHDGVVGRAVGEDRHLAWSSSPRRPAPGTRRPGRFGLAGKTVEVALPNLGHLGVSRLFVVAGAAREEPGPGMIGSRQRAIWMPSLSTSRYRPHDFIEARSSAPSTFPRSNGFSG